MQILIEWHCLEWVWLGGRKEGMGLFGVVFLRAISERACRISNKEVLKWFYCSFVFTIVAFGLFKFRFFIPLVSFFLPSNSC